MSASIPCALTSACSYSSAFFCATGCGYAIIFILYRLGFLSPHLDMPGLGQGFKGYKVLICYNFTLSSLDRPLSPIG